MLEQNKIVLRNQNQLNTSLYKIINDGTVVIYNSIIFSNISGQKTINKSRPIMALKSDNFQRLHNKVHMGEIVRFLAMLHCQKSYPNFRILYNMKCRGNKILHEIFRVVSHLPHYISCYIVESRLSLGQCTVLYVCKKAYNRKQ